MSDIQQQQQQPQNLSGRLDIAGARLTGKLLHNGLTNNGLGDLADGIIELVSPTLEEFFGELFGKKPIEFPAKLVEAVQTRIINGMNSRLNNQGNQSNQR